MAVSVHEAERPAIRAFPHLANAPVGGAVLVLGDAAREGALLRESSASVRAAHRNPAFFRARAWSASLMM